MTEVIARKSLLVAVMVAGIILVGCDQSKQPEVLVVPQADMKIESSAFGNNQSIPTKYTCDGANISPPLKVSDVPEGARSLILTVDDPDAPAGTFVHWTVRNIDPATTDIAEGVTPTGATVREGITDFGKSGYGGPCPPSGIHHYQFKLYALDTTFDLDSSSSKKDIETAMAGHVLAQSLLVGLYGRK